MDNPVLVEVTRGGRVESAHRGRLAVVDADGKAVLSLGDIAEPIFPRSAVKAIQALILAESGAIQRFDLSQAELALACASHNGEPLHAETAAGMLKKAGRKATCLECGAHWPMHEAAAHALARSGREPSALHNNCSGKHAGFVCAAVAMEEEPAGYIRPDHPVMADVTGALEDVCGYSLGSTTPGIDGCSIPTYAIPLHNLAHGFARFGTGQGFGMERARAAARIRAACAAEPFMVAGMGRFDTEIMTALRARAFTKTGAEGVFCAALPEVGLGIALKIDDGATRAAQVVMASLIERFLTLNEAEAAAVTKAKNPQLKNWNGMGVGELHPATGLR
jgi:L-asparaginase II